MRPALAARAAAESAAAGSSSVSESCDGKREGWRMKDVGAGGGGGGPGGYVRRRQRTGTSPVGRDTTAAAGP